MPFPTSNGPSGASGTILYIGTTAATALTDTYTRIGSLESLSEFGPQFGDITFEDLSTGLVEHYKGARDDGSCDVGVGRDVDDAGQQAMLAALLAKDNYNFKFEYNDSVPARSSSVTISVASPGVVTMTAHGLAVDTAVVLATSGTLPTGLTPGTTYYVKSVLTADTFTLAATKGGTVINTTGSAGTGHTLTTVPTPTVEYVKGKVFRHRRVVGNLQSVVRAIFGLGFKSGSLTTVNRLPAAVVG